MARMIPPSVRDFNGSPGEAAVYAALQLLPAQVTVLHSVRLQATPGGWQRSSELEADFVVVDPAHGCLIVEVKGGDISLADGVWTQVNRKTGDSCTIEPMLQARRVTHALRKLIGEAAPQARQVHFGYAVWFPDAQIAGAPLPPEYQGGVVLDADSLVNPHAALLGAFDHWATSLRWKTTSAEAAHLVVDYLAPAVTLTSAGPLPQQTVGIAESLQHVAAPPTQASPAPIVVGRKRALTGQLFAMLRLLLSLPLFFLHLVVRFVGSFLFWALGGAWNLVTGACSIVCGAGIIIGLGAGALFLISRHEAALTWMSTSFGLSFVAFAALLIGQEFQMRLQASRAFTRLREFLTLA